jgi:hypothetical protein
MKVVMGICEGIVNRLRPQDRGGPAGGVAPTESSRLSGGTPVSQLAVEQLRAYYGAVHALDIRCTSGPARS